MKPFHLQVGACAVLVLAGLLQLLPVGTAPSSGTVESDAPPTQQPQGPITFSGEPMFSALPPSQAQAPPAQAAEPVNETPPTLVGVLGASAAIFEYEGNSQQITLGEQVGCWTLQSISRLTVELSCGAQQSRQSLYSSDP